jgi:hypothetical protein
MLTLQGDCIPVNHSSDDVTDQRPVEKFRHPLLNKTAREIEQSFRDDMPIPETPYNELPSDFVEVNERKRIEWALLNERQEVCLRRFYREMNDTAASLNLVSSHFAVAHGMHHYDNYSTAMDVAKLS